VRLARRAVAALAACAALALLLPGWPGDAEAKKFRYAAGPKPPADTTFTVVEEALEPIVRERGPRVPPTNLQVVALVANVAFDKALEGAPIERGDTVRLAPAESHPLNFAIEHAVLRHLSKRGIVTQVRRSILSDDSLATLAAGDADPLLEYQLASARVTYLRLRGWLPGRVKIERQALVEGVLTLRDPRSAQVLWVGDAKYSLLDAFPRGQVRLVEDDRFSDLKSEMPARNIDKVFEPVIVVAVVAGLAALFFQNRP
jgi:hypothetical protein